MLFSLYAYVRHPIYTGVIFMNSGACISSQVPVLAAAVVGAVTAVYWNKASKEELMLVQHFGKAYTAYQKRTKRLVPWVL